ncbi:tripartite motif-containing protein 16-like isoform X1 [Brienomyrus brachyistius]|uniref:tripartite motif-containing protein 16-like isoform X1 n=1 Tax=Brienomyrus brachyistius TaxID=42636 RepID=UPI0020B2493E|nr:tripartite motif-containing protein 16-like isoform X1 [Brienomyrus brachyistius]
MAEAVDLLNQEQFSCPICLDLLNDPVAIPCGHSYCMSCINSYWDQEDNAEVYSCPQCRQTFTPKPLLNINIMLSEVVEKLKKKTFQDFSPADHYAGPGDVECDVCTGRKHKAVKSCLVCLASYCESHLQPHYESPAFKKHKLTDATGRLQDKVCPHHDKPLEVYCRTDQQCICYLCTMDKHRGHDNVSITTARTENERQLRTTQKTIQQRIQLRGKELLELRKALESLTCSAQTAAKDSERMFNELIDSVRRKCLEVKELVGDQEKTAVIRTKGLVEKLERDILQLKKRESELEKLSQTEDDIHFLQHHPTLCTLPGTGVLPATPVNQKQCCFRAVSAAVNKLKDKLREKLEEEGKEILEMITEEGPTTREEFLKYACRITLDSNTANSGLALSCGNQSVSTGNQRSYLRHPERFTSCPQVLCREALSGFCYWEVEWDGKDGVDIAVAYKSISRSGVGENFRQGTKSWSLHCTQSGYQFYHNNENTAILGPYAPRIGVYLNYKAGILSFYSISNTMTLLHRVRTTFTEPLYPGFSLHTKLFFSQFASGELNSIRRATVKIVDIC